MKNKIIRTCVITSISLMGVFSVFAVSSININQASPTCVNLVSNNLYYGSTDNITGGEVTKLQNFLKLNSYLSSSATGYFGLGTYNAVRQFQKANNIQITGFVGPLTKAKIKEKSCYTQGSSVSSVNTNTNTNTNTNINVNTSNPNTTGNGPVSNSPNYWRPGGVMCTMEARLCPDGSMMPRNAACQWLPNLCNSTTTTQTPIGNTTNINPVINIQSSMCAYGSTNCSDVLVTDNGTSFKSNVFSTTNETQGLLSKYVLGSGTYTYSVLSEGKNRDYILYVPTNYRKLYTTPLVMFFHGGSGNMDTASKNYGWKEKADKEGFIVAFLNGSSRLESGKIATWNAGNCCGYARDNNKDDVGYVKLVLADIKSKINIDSTKVFATGFSNGGMFSYRLACDLSSYFSAIGSVAGTDNYDQCSPTSPVSVIHIHAVNDDHVLFNGGAGPDAFRNPDSVTDFTSVMTTISRWKTRDGTMNASTTSNLVPGAYCDVFLSGNKSKKRVKLCVTQTGGHSWPGTSPFGSTTPSNAINATDMIWDFFKSQLN